MDYTSHLQYKNPADWCMRMACCSVRCTEHEACCSCENATMWDNNALRLWHRCWQQRQTTRTLWHHMSVRNIGTFFYFYFFRISGMLCLFVCSYLYTIYHIYCILLKSTIGTNIYYLIFSARYNGSQHLVLLLSAITVKPFWHTHTTGNLSSDGTFGMLTSWRRCESCISVKWSWY